MTQFNPHYHTLSKVNSSKKPFATHLIKSNIKNAAQRNSKLTENQKNIFTKISNKFFINTFVQIDLQIANNQNDKSMTIFFNFFHHILFSQLVHYFDYNTFCNSSTTKTEQFRKTNASIRRSKKLKTSSQQQNTENQNSKLTDPNEISKTAVEKAFSLLRNKYDQNCFHVWIFFVIPFANMFQKCVNNFQQSLLKTKQFEICANYKQFSKHEITNKIKSENLNIELDWPDIQKFKAALKFWIMCQKNTTIF